MKKIVTILILLLSILFLLDLNKDAAAEQRYNNYVVYLDAGHGGYDGGASTRDGAQEKDLNLAISLYLRNYLESVGIKVLMIRDTDISLTDGSERTKKRSDMMNRIKLIRESDADLFISIHMNAFPSGRWYGSQTFYNSQDPNNKLIAEAIQKNLKDTLKNTYRNAKPSNNLFILKYSEKVGALVEAGFLSNSREGRLLQKPIYQQKVAYAIFLGIIEYFDQTTNSYS
ncbi:N-acetylmuramoyl-L-alanine amidase [Haloplasma contractile]|uniref:Germination-specific N-acetylmuramoyl-L-alanine amidase protein n=1 Tax=Haloplasma contractile SSD-17B TaxID=1033810 RepID=U2DYQ4_9MOLU|nr:N-acetylmuramoyl-L-alanine amidase [Haloplasma contractile]ERJ13377.1 Germination-specific N-acetylmuramoyl-L-alanine amidase protein [Haloplasma contractile SSD-17B]